MAILTCFAEFICKLLHFLRRAFFLKERQPVTEEPKNDSKGSYVVVLRAPSAARFEVEDNLSINRVPCATGTVDLIFRTRYVNEGFSAPVPRELWVDARGKASSLKDALVSFANASYTLSPIITVSANAFVEDLEVELGYDDTAGLSEREYFQQFVPEERGLPRLGRRINAPATAALLLAFAVHPESERMHRAASQYRLALAHWHLGRETLALAHLYMGMEALSKVLVRTECRARGITEAELAEFLGIRPRVDEDELLTELKRNSDSFSSEVMNEINARVNAGKFKVAYAVESHLRRSVLFKGDENCYKKARAASDGFEHGFKPFSEVRTLATEVRDRAAQYLRSALIELSGINEDQKQLLLTTPYDIPIGYGRLVKYLWGHLLGTNTDLAEKSQQYPFLRWQSSIESFSRRDSGEYELVPNETVTGSFGENISFRASNLEIWGQRTDNNPDSDHENNLMNNDR